jgi:hypothetical protein
MVKVCTRWTVASGFDVFRECSAANLVLSLVQLTRVRVGVKRSSIDLHVIT